MTAFEKALNQPEQTNGIARDPIIAALPVYAAVERIKMALTEDEGLRIAWQSNIAATFVNEIEKITKTLASTSAIYDRRYEIANNAAVNFLNNLCATK